MPRNKFTGVISVAFNRQFKDDNDCYQYLSLLKWEDGYICRKCGNDKKPFSRRCLKCKYDESPTANSIFEKLRFSILVAFHIVFFPKNSSHFVMRPQNINRIGKHSKFLVKELLLNVELNNFRAFPIIAGSLAL